MSTYYKETLSGAPIYRVAAARMTYERANGTIGEVDFDAAGGGASTWAAVEAFEDFPAVMAYGADAQEARNAIGAVSADDLPDAPTWTTIEGKPAVVAAGTTQATARTSIAAAASGANGDITSLTGITTPLSAAQGGTGTTSLDLLATALNITAFMPGLAPTISNIDTWTTGGIRALTTTTVGRPTGTANGDIVMALVTATNAAQFAFIMASGKLVYRVFTTSWQPWQDVTHTALA